MRLLLALHVFLSSLATSRARALHQQRQTQAPGCLVECLVSVNSQIRGCGDLDNICFCRSTLWVTNVARCIPNLCQGMDVQEARAYVSETCEGVGITVDLPRVAQVVSSIPTPSLTSSSITLATTPPLTPSLPLVSTSSSTTDSERPSRPPSPDQPQSSAGNNSLLVSLIVVAVVVFLGLVIGAIVYLRRQRTRNDAPRIRVPFDPDPELPVTEVSPFMPTSDIPVDPFATPPAPNALISAYGILPSNPFTASASALEGSAYNEGGKSEEEGARGVRRHSSQITETIQLSTSAPFSSPLMSRMPMPNPSTYDPSFPPAMVPGHDSFNRVEMPSNSTLARGMTERTVTRSPPPPSYRTMLGDGGP